MGIVASGSSFGGVCLPIMFSKLIPTIGFPWALRVGALIMVICYAIAIAVSSSKRPKRKMRSLRDLLDYKGFLDIRYSCLSAGAVISSLGIYVPFYYIGKCMNPPLFGFVPCKLPSNKIQSRFVLPLIRTQPFDLTSSR